MNYFSSQALSKFYLFYLPVSGKWMSFIFCAVLIDCRKIFHFPLFFSHYVSAGAEEIHSMPPKIPEGFCVCKPCQKCGCL